MFQAYSPNTLSDQIVTLSENPFVNHIQVRENEAIIWQHIRDEIENTISHVDNRGKVHVLEIGGASMLGLKTLSQSEYFSKLSYTIVDCARPFDATLLQETGARYLQMGTHDLTAHLLPSVNLVVAVRALEYDTQFEKTLRFLHSISSRPAYGIFVHNAEDSKAFDDVRRFSSILNFRTHVYPLGTRVVDGDIDLETALSLAQAETSGMTEDLADKEIKRFAMFIKKALLRTQESPSSTQEFIQEKIDLYQKQLALVHHTYGERLISRRFWSRSETELQEIYIRSNVLHLHRANALLSGTGIRVHIDTVDIYNAWIRPPSRISDGPIFPPAEFDIELRS